MKSIPTKFNENISNLHNCQNIKLPKNNSFLLSMKCPQYISAQLEKFIIFEVNIRSTGTELRKSCTFISTKLHNTAITVSPLSTAMAFIRSECLKFNYKTFYGSAIL